MPIEDNIMERFEEKVEKEMGRSIEEIRECPLKHRRSDYPSQTLEMNPLVGRLGHEVSGLRMKSREDIERELDEAIYGPHFTGIKKAFYIGSRLIKDNLSSAYDYFSRNS